MTSKEEWMSIIDVEEGHRLSVSVVEEVLQKTQDVIFQRRIQAQLIPYTLNYFRNTVLRVVEWRFLKRDKCILDEKTWIPDAEPEPVEPDSWARGIIPVRKAVAVPKTLKPKESFIVANTAPKSTRSSSTSSIQSGLDDKSNKDKDHRKPINFSKENRLRKPAPIVSELSLENIVEPKKELTLDELIKEENRKMLVRIHNMEKDGAKADFTFDHEGRILLLKKSVPPKLSSQTAKAQVADVKEASRTKQTRGLVASLRKSNIKQKAIEQATVIVPEHLFDNQDKEDFESFVPDNNLESTAFTDILKVSPGVTVKEGDLIRKGGPPLQKSPLNPNPPITEPNSIGSNPNLAKILERARPIVSRKD